MSKPALLLLALFLPLSALAAPAGRFAGQGPDLARMPIRFEPAANQTAPAQFVARGLNYQLFLTREGPVLVVNGNSRRAAVRVRFAGLAARARATGENPLASVSHYLGRGRTRSDVPNFGRVRYRQVWPGIDVVFYGKEGRLEYDFELAPHADPSVVHLAADGADDVQLGAGGQLELHTAAGILHLRPPVAYQAGPEGERRFVSANYRLDHGQVRLAIGPYDPGKALVIDPVIDYSGFLGGGGLERGFALAVDSSGSAYVAGVTESSDFPASFGVLQARNGGGQDAFVAKIDPSGTQVQFATYLGGSDQDSAQGVGVLSNGAVVVAGSTRSSNFPVSIRALQRTYGGGGSDCFVTRLKADGSDADFSTYYGDTDDDACWALAVGPNDSIYVAGETKSDKFPVTPGAYKTRFGGDRDAFVARFDPSGSPVLYSTYVGGGGAEAAYGLAVDHLGNACITGYTSSNEFPHTNDAFLTSYRGGSRDAFLTLLDSVGQSLTYSTFLGGSGQETGSAAAFDLAGRCYVAGDTDSRQFAVFGRAYQQVYASGDRDAFVAAVDRQNQIVYSTYLGGEGADLALGLAVDATGNAIIGGSTTSERFPVTADALQAKRSGARDGFVTVLSADGSQPLSSTFIGDTSDDQVRAVTLDRAGRVYLTGETASSRFPSTGGTYQGGTDAFLTRLRDMPVVRSVATVSAASYREGAQAPGSIVSAFSADLASGLFQAQALPLPSTLGGVRVTLRDSQGFEFTSPLFFVAPQQINFLVPAGVAAGTASIRVERDSKVIALSEMMIGAPSPGIFTANADGTGVPAAIAVTNTFLQGQVSRLVFNDAPVGQRAPVPINLGGANEETVLELFGTGIPPGSQVTATIGGQSVPVLFAGQQSQFAGLIQINVALPKSLAGRGLLLVVITVDGVAANPVQILIQ